MGEQLIYVYAIVPSGLSLREPDQGVDGSAVERIDEGALSALVSRVDARRFASESIAEMSLDLDWLAPIARAHDAIVTRASDAGAVIPLPLFTLFLDDERVRAMLRERRADLGHILKRVAKGREYTIRVHRLDQELLEHGLARLSEHIAALERDAAAASPGQRYLLERKIEREKRDELHRVGAEVAEETLSVLSAHALESATDPLPAPRGEGGRGSAVLNAAFLVSADALDEFRRTLTNHIGRYEPIGFRFEFTGPWPPFHFVKDAHRHGTP